MSEACHNCRRQRLKCDRSLPHCTKCIKRGQQCLGYQRLLRWGNGVASRGKMMGTTFGRGNRDRPRHENPSPPMVFLADPLIQDVNHVSRKYLSYFASDVCRDLVLYDIPKHNPFRELVPLTHQHPVLLQIMIANSALHMSNACLPGPTSGGSLAMRQLESYSHALAAKQKALSLLKSTLTSISSVNIDVILAAVLLFIEFELIDSGRDNWRYHVNGARTIIEMLCGSDISTQTSMSPLRRCLVSNCLVFDILGSTLAPSTTLVSGDALSNGTLSLLQDAEGNHCSSFPATLLDLIRVGAQLSQSTQPTLIPDSSTSSKQEQVLLLLNTAQSFDPHAWAENLQSRSPATDFLFRMHIASAHRAAVCIYLSRILLSLYPATQLPYSLESFEVEIILHISFITPKDPMFAAIAWPAFIAGAETDDEATRKWVVGKFEELWKVEPWGLIREALGVLEKLWARRSVGETKNGNSTLPDETKEGDSWIKDLRTMGVDWLII